MGSRERRDRDKQQTRQLILDTARQLFAEKGFEAVTMRMIAQQIEYSPTAIYVHFEDKEALMRELSALDFASLSESVLRARSVKDPVDRLRRCGRAYLAFALEHPNQYRLLFMTSKSAHKKDLEGFNDPQSSAYAMLREGVQFAIDGKVFKPAFKDADMITQILWTSLHGLISLRLCMGASDAGVPWRPMAKAADLTMDTLLAGFSA